MCPNIFLIFKLVFDKTLNGEGGKERKGKEKRKWKGGKGKITKIQFEKKGSLKFKQICYLNNLLRDRMEREGKREKGTEKKRGGGTGNT